MRSRSSLTPKQEAFCLAYVETGNASEAYRRAYPRSKNWRPETVHREAHALLNHPKISTRIEALQAESRRLGLWTREQSIRALAEIATSGCPAEIIATVRELNRMHGYDAPEKVEMTGAGGGPVVLNIKHREEPN